MDKKYLLCLVNPNEIPHRNNCIVRQGSDLNQQELEICEKALNGEFIDKNDIEWKIERLMDEYGKITGVAMDGFLISTLINELL